MDRPRGADTGDKGTGAFLRLHCEGSPGMAGRVAFRHRSLRNATVYVDGSRVFFGPYKDAVHFYETTVGKRRGQKELQCVVCGSKFDRNPYRVKLTCSTSCKIIHVTALTKKSA